MHTTEKFNPLYVSITAQCNTSVLPRCLQILSRRGFMLTELQTEQFGTSQIIMHCTLLGPDRWHSSLIPLLERVVDVIGVKEITHD